MSYQELTKIALYDMPELREYVAPNGKLNVVLERALYALVQFAKLWYKTLSKFLNGLGFEENLLDKCMLKMTQNGMQISLVLYVDNIYVHAKGRENVN